MVAPIRGPAVAPLPPKPEESKPASDAEQLSQLLTEIGRKLETAWQQAISTPSSAGDHAARVEQRQDSLGFSTSEPGSTVAPSKDFAETAARIWAAKVDGLATKAEAGALIYSMAIEMRLAQEAGVSKADISKTMARMFGEFRIGVGLGDDLLPIADDLGGQLSLIGMMGDHPDAYEKLGLDLLGGKPPAPAKQPPPAEVIVTGSATEQGEAGALPLVVEAPRSEQPHHDPQRQQNLQRLQDEQRRQRLQQEEELRRDAENRRRRG